jgi:hypothetical protein
VIFIHTANVKNILHFSKKTRHFFVKKFAEPYALQIFTISHWPLACLSATRPCSASAVSVAVQALQNAKLKICEQAPVFNLRLLHLRCATAVALGLIAALAFQRYRLRLRVFIRI